MPQHAPASGFRDASEFGFSPDASGLENAQALQRAVDRGGTISVARPGVYRIAATVFVGSQTEILFGRGVFLQKVDEAGPFTHVLLNKGALSRTWDEHIHIQGLHVIVNGVDVRQFLVFGLHGQIAFFYVRDLRLDGFRCLDLGRSQYAIHVCTFEDLIIDDVIIHGGKDGVHLGRGRRFTIRNGVFKTYDDAVALNAHDYDVGNPELGWIENGVVENCHDLNADRTVGFFCRILAGGWVDWREGMEVQKSDTVVSDGRLYRVSADPDGRVYRSVTRPTHAEGRAVLDGITWVMTQPEAVRTAGVRHVVFRDIVLEKPRIGFSVYFDSGRFSRSWYPGAPVPRQEGLLFENVRVLHQGAKAFLEVGTPVDVVTVSHCLFRNNTIFFHGVSGLDDYLPTRLNLIGCTFHAPARFEVVRNTVPGKTVTLTTTASAVTEAGFGAAVAAGPGTILVRSDLPGLENPSSGQVPPTPGSGGTVTEK